MKDIFLVLLIPQNLFTGMPSQVLGRINFVLKILKCENMVHFTSDNDGGLKMCQDKIFAGAFEEFQGYQNLARQNNFPIHFLGFCEASSARLSLFIDIPMFAGPAPIFEA
jgi:hypothetical protein